MHVDLPFFVLYYRFMQSAYSSLFYVLWQSTFASFMNVFLLTYLVYTHFLNEDNF